MHKADGIIAVGQPIFIITAEYVDEEGDQIIGFAKTQEEAVNIVNVINNRYSKINKGSYRNCKNATYQEFYKLVIKPICL